MAVRSTMASLIQRVRQLINDPVSTSQTFSDQEIQDVLDVSRLNIANLALSPKATFTGSTIQYLDYYSEGFGNWEDGVVLRQYLTREVTPSASELIVGHWNFTESTLPPIYATGHSYDCYRAAADLLERQAAKWATSYNITVAGQNLQRNQVMQNLLNLAQSYRRKQRAVSVSAVRSDLASPGPSNGLTLGPTAIDYMASGDGR